MQIMVSPTPPYVLLTKKLGQTPLEAIDAWRLENPQYKDVPATYAGRLDPMAEGMLLVLLGEECKRQDRYRGLDKEYEIELLLDLSTDTGDVLGIPSYDKKDTHPSAEEVRPVLTCQTGTQEVPYPAFSSKTVNGKPLFVYSLEGSLNSIEIPTHNETIYRIQDIRHEDVDINSLKTRIMDMLSRAPKSTEPSKQLGADFRQDEIRAAWTSLFESISARTFTVLTLRVTCASGSYMRTLAERIGKDLGTGGMTLSIRRTKIGAYQKILGIGFWLKRFR